MSEATINNYISLLDLTGDNLHFKEGNKERYFFQLYRKENSKNFIENSEN